MKFAIVVGLALVLTSCGGDDLVLPDEGTPAAISIVRGNNQSATVGSILPDSLVVKVVDREGRPVPSQSVSFEVIAGGGSVAPDDARTDANGLAGTSWTLGTGAGAQQVLAKPVGNGTPSTVQITFSANAGASSASTLSLVSGDDQTATAGTALDDSLVVRATDASNNPVAGVTVTWTITGGGAVSATTVTTGADGRSAVRRTLGATAGAQTTIATASGLDGSPITFNATATVGSAGRLIIQRQPSTTASSGTPFVTQPRVQLADANGNPVTTSGISVQAQIASGPGGASLSGVFTSTTNTSGLATFANLGISGPAGSYTLNFVVPNRDDISGSPPSSAINLTAGSASRLVYLQQPGNIVAGGTITPAVRVGIQDALGNPVTSATNQVTVAFGANPGAANLGGTKTVAAVAGVATFSTLTVDKPGNGYTLQASASGLSGVTSSQFNVSTGSASNIAANSASTLTGTAGSPVSPAPSVKVTDGAGNAVPGVSVTFAVTSGGGSVSGESQTTNSSGVATVGSWVLGPTAGNGNNTLTATSAGLSGSPVTFTASATAGSAGKLVFVTHPASSGQSGVALNPQPVLQLVDQNDNPVSQGGVPVTASLASGPGGTLGGTAEVNTNSQGRAIFTSLTINGPSGTYTLSFGGGTVTGVTSGDIVIGSGAATRLDLATPPSSAVQSGVNFPVQPVVQLEDGSGNPVGTSGVTVSVTAQSCSGKTLGGDAEVATNSAGEAVFTDLRLTGTVGNCTLLFAASGLTGVSSSAITVGPGAPAATTSSLTVDPSAVTAGSPATVTITVKDASGNAVSGVNVALTTDADGTFGSSSIVTGADGTASTSYTPNSTGSHNLDATVGALTESVTLEATAGAVSGATSSLTFESPSVLAYDPAVAGILTLKDVSGNPVTGRGVTFSVAGLGTIAPTSGTTEGDGTIAVEFSGQQFGANTVTANVQGSTVTPTAEVAVVTLPVDAGLSGFIMELQSGGGPNPAVGTQLELHPNPRAADGSFLRGALTKFVYEGTGIVTQSPPDSGWSAGPYPLSHIESITTTLAQTVTVRMLVNGVDFGLVNSVEFLPDGASPVVSLAVQSPITVGQTSQVTATLTDVFGNPLSGVAIDFTAPAGSFDPSSDETDAAGLAMSVYTPPAAAGTYTVTANYGAGDSEDVVVTE